MRLNCINQDYTSLTPGLGVYPNAYVSDCLITHNRHDKVLVISYALFFEKEGITEKAFESKLTFNEHRNDPSILLVDHGNGEITEESIHFYLYKNQEIPVDNVIDWGYPSYSDVRMFFIDGSPANPELLWKDWIGQNYAKNWLLNNLTLDNQVLKNNFEYPTEEVTS